MSQAKVDRYKEEKKNRAQIMAKEKREWMMVKLGGGLLAVVLAGWIGASVYYNVTNKPETATETEVEKPVYTVNTTALDDYLGSLELD